MTRPAHATIGELLDRLRSGACSAVEIVEDLLDGIARWDSALHAYVSVDPGDALRAARSADARRAAGGELPPLLGIPVGIKDSFLVEGWPCRCASRMLEGFTATYDAEAVARLRRAGAIPLGRLNLDEFAMGSTTETSAQGPTRNPWDPGRVPGGSSGGPAAAVAARTALAALGSDTGGSIRQPAAFCGCVGLRPTYGRVSRRGLVAFASSLDQPGPLARTSEDAAWLLHALAGRDPGDPTTADRPPPGPPKPLPARAVEGLRLGLPRELFDAGLDPEVEARVREAVDVFRSRGAEVSEVSLPHARFAVAVYCLIAYSEASANLARFDGVRYGRRVEASDPDELIARSRAGGFGDEVKRRILLGAFALSRGYAEAFYRRAETGRTLIARDFEAVFGRCDILAAPVAPTAAFRIGERIGDPLSLYLGDALTIPACLAPACSLSTPCGFTRGGLPVGLQLIGPAFGETRILDAARDFERETGWVGRAPPVCETPRGGEGAP